MPTKHSGPGGGHKNQKVEIFYQWKILSVDFDNASQSKEITFNVIQEIALY